MKRGGKKEKGGVGGSDNKRFGTQYHEGEREREREREMETSLGMYVGNADKTRGTVIPTRKMSG